MSQATTAFTPYTGGFNHKRSVNGMPSVVTDNKSFFDDPNNRAALSTNRSRNVLGGTNSVTTKTIPSSSVGMARSNQPSFKDGQLGSQQAGLTLTPRQKHGVFSNSIAVPSTAESNMAESRYQKTQKNFLQRVEQTQ